MAADPSWPGPDDATSSFASTLEFRELSSGQPMHVVAGFRTFDLAGAFVSVQLTRHLTGTYRDLSDIGVPDATSYTGFMVGGPLEFLYGGGVPSGSFGYRGTATAIDGAPIPEPATFFLMGSGLAALVRQRLRRKATERPDRVGSTVSALWQK